MTSTGLGLLALAAFAIVALSLKGWRDHRDALDARARMLDGCADTFANARITLAPDGFPILRGELPDGRAVKVEMIADTLVVRRLPQLWLSFTIHDDAQPRAFAIGALARATGAEFYSASSGLPERIDHSLELPLTMRGRHVPDEIRRRGRLVFADLFADPRLKEAVLTSRGMRIVRQASEGDRASHLLLRQVRFGLGAVSPDLVQLALNDAERLRRGLLEEIRLAEVA